MNRASSYSRKVFLIPSASPLALASLAPIIPLRHAISYPRCDSKCFLKNLSCYRFRGFPEACGRVSDQFSPCAHCYSRGARESRRHLKLFSVASRPWILSPAAFRHGYRGVGARLLLLSAWRNSQSITRRGPVASFLDDGASLYKRRGLAVDPDDRFVCDQDRRVRELRRCVNEGREPRTERRVFGRRGHVGRVASPSG